MATNFLTKLFGSRNDRLLKQYRKTVARINAMEPEYEKLSDDRLGEPSAAIRQRVEAARGRQAARFAGTRLLANADMGPAEVRDFCRPDDVPA